MAEIDLSSRKRWVEFYQNPSQVRLCTGWTYWRGIELVEQVHTQRRFEMLSNMHTLFTRVGSPTRYQFREGPKLETPLIVPGAVSMVGAGPRWVVESDGGAQHDIGIKLDPEFLLEAADMAGIALKRADLYSRFAILDTRLTEVMKLLADDYRAGSPFGVIFGESLATMMAVHVAQNYGDHPNRSVASPGRLSTTQLKQVEDLIRARISERLSLHDIAHELGYSAYHFHRVFRQQTGVPLHEYVLRQRVALAKSLLINTDLSSEAVAAECGFSDSSHLSRALKRETGLPPTAFRRQARSS